MRLPPSEWASRYTSASARLWVLVSKCQTRSMCCCLIYCPTAKSNNITQKRWNITFWVILFWSKRSSHVPELWEQWPNITAAFRYQRKKAKAWGWSSGIRPEPPEAREQLKPKFFSPSLFFFSKKPETVNYNKTRSLLGMETTATATNSWCYYSKTGRDEGVILPLRLLLQRSQRSSASSMTCCSWHPRGSVKSVRRNMWTSN